MIPSKPRHPAGLCPGAPQNPQMALLSSLISENIFTNPDIHEIIQSRNSSEEWSLRISVKPCAVGSPRCWVTSGHAGPGLLFVTAACPVARAELCIADV